MIPVSLTPDRFRLGLHAANSAKHGNGAVQNAKRAFDFYRKVDMTGSVDEVDFVVFPLTGGNSRSNGDASLLFLLHPVHDGRAFMHFADLMGTSGVIEYPLAYGGFSCVDVSDDTNVAVFLELPSVSHCAFSPLEAVIGYPMLE
jgi:hypothetical protein